MRHPRQNFYQLVLGQAWSGDRGFGLIEVIVAVALIAVLSVVAVTTVVGSFSTNRLSQDETEATLLAQQGLEAAHSIKRKGWTSPFLATDCSSGCGLTAGGSGWTWSGSNNVLGDYTRVVTISSVQRDGSNTIVTSGGSDDPDTKRITSTVTWDFSPSRSNSITLETYVTNYLKSIIGDWSNISQVGYYDTSGNSNGIKIAVSGNYVYIVTSGGSPDFYAVDVSTPASPTLADTLSLAGTLYDVVVDGNYAYVASNDNSNELIVVNISNPTNISQVGSYNAPGTSDALGLDVVGNRLYMVTTNSTDEFYVINISTPASPSYLGSTNLGSTANAVKVLGNYAYVASDSNSEELQVVDVTNPASPNLVGSYDASGSGNGETVTGAGSTVYLGRESNDDVLSFSVSTPTSPSLLDTYPYGDNVRDLSLGSGDSYLFVAGDLNSAELVVLDVSDPSDLTVLGSYNASSDLNGVVYSSTLDRAFGASESNSEELSVFAPS